MAAETNAGLLSGGGDQGEADQREAGFIGAQRVAGLLLKLPA
ncbi:hypothetical protein [Hansschlegelia beijingensis]|uniref:Uncharacterized protein n=1 Tax=Hansschlegelia beijingensis TaxID=1133344 RepID=A0A7W6GH34_9HYPH|nr:hypothetical protein [Hansschlegelia beijingensis]MBB3974748.1 hypothetical protein [Hansschlegelia beijingensis]